MSINSAAVKTPSEVMRVKLSSWLLDIGVLDVGTGGVGGEGGDDG